MTSTRRFEAVLANQLVICQCQREDIQFSTIYNLGLELVSRLVVQFRSQFTPLYTTHSLVYSLSYNYIYYTTQLSMNPISLLLRLSIFMLDDHFDDPRSCSGTSAS